MPVYGPEGARGRPTRPEFGAMYFYGGEFTALPWKASVIGKAGVTSDWVFYVVYEPYGTQPKEFDVVTTSGTKIGRDEIIQTAGAVSASFGPVNITIGQEWPGASSPRGSLIGAGCYAVGAGLNSQEYRAAGGTLGRVGISDLTLNAYYWGTPIAAPRADAPGGEVPLGPLFDGFTIHEARSDPTEAQGGSYSLGLEFYVTEPMEVKQIHSLRGVNAATEAALYQVGEFVNNGIKLTPTLTFPTPHTASRQIVDLPEPVLLVPNQRYRAVIFCPNGINHRTNFWSGSGPGAAGLVNGPLVAPNAATAFGGAQGSYSATAVLMYPASAAAGSDFCVDVLVAYPSVPAGPLMHLGDTQIDKLMLGTSEIAIAYLGETNL